MSAEKDFKYAVVDALIFKNLDRRLRAWKYKPRTESGKWLHIENENRTSRPII